MTVIAALAVVAVGAGLALNFARARRRERHEVENMFSTDGEDRSWWEERR